MWCALRMHTPYCSAAHMILLQCADRLHCLRSALLHAHHHLLLLLLHRVRHQGPWVARAGAMALAMRTLPFDFMQAGVGSFVWFNHTACLCLSLIHIMCWPRCAPLFCPAGRPMLCWRAAVQADIRNSRRLYCHSGAADAQAAEAPTILLVKPHAWCAVRIHAAAVRMRGVPSVHRSCSHACMTGFA